MKKAHNSINILGMKFNRLTVIGEGFLTKHKQRKWECLCDCGNKTFAIYTKLKLNKTKSCGCYKTEMIKKLGNKSFIDLTGKKFGELTVLKRISGKGINIKYLTICSCGKEKITRAGSLRQGSTSSCGHLMVESMKNAKKILQVKHRANNNNPFLNIRIRQIIKGLKRRTKTIKLLIDKFELYELIKKPCYYCGKLEVEFAVKNKFLKGGGNINEIIPTNGLDRLDSNKDYTLDNVVPCCGECNIRKTSSSLEQFKEHTIRIYKHMKLDELTT